MTSPLSISFSTMEQREPRELGGLAQAVRERHRSRRSALARLLGQRREQRRVEQARRDRHDADALVGQVARRRQRHADDAALGGRVGDLADLPVVGGGRRGVDAHAALAVLACGSLASIAAAAKRSTLKVPIRLIPMMVSKGMRSCGPRLPAIFCAQPVPAQHTQMRSPPPACAACSAAASTSSSSRDVGVHEGRAVAELVGQRLPALVVDVGDGHARRRRRAAGGRSPRRAPTPRRRRALHFPRFSWRGTLPVYGPLTR